MLNRRSFIKNSLIATSAMAVNNVFANKNDIQKLVILHTNDVHSRIEPFPADDKKYPNMGGVAMRATIINEIRTAHENVLLLDAGDLFQGTPYFNFFLGKVEIELMNQLKYDACTIGNHDFDGGIDNLKTQINNANFPFINSNYNFNNSILNGKVHQHIVLKKQSLKIGITGCGIELNGLVPEKLYGNIMYNNPIESVQKEVDILKNEYKCDFIICLSHLGYKYDSSKISDIVLAEKTKDIDLIIGGHTHTFLDKPDRRKNLDGKEVLINQVGWAGLQLGMIEYFFEKKSKNNISKSHTVIVRK